MASFLQYFQKGGKNEIISGKDLLTRKREADIKMHKLKDDLNYYSNLLNEEKTNKIKKENKKKKKGKKKSKQLSVNSGFKAKRNFDTIRKRIVSSKTRLNKSLSNLKMFKKNDDNDSLINLPKINTLRKKNPLIKSFGYFKLNDEKLFNSNENKNEKLILNKMEIHNFMLKRQLDKGPNKIKLKKNSANEKLKIIINEVLNDISSMNGGHTNNFTSKYLIETSKRSDNALNGLISYDTNMSINVNIRKENKSISASVNNNNNKNQTQNIRKNSINLKEENKNEKVELEKEKIYNSAQHLENDNNRRKYSNNNNLKSKTSLFFNLRNKRKEELEKRFMIIRKDYREKDSNINNNNNKEIHIIKTYYYLIIPGNASYLVKNCMQHRINWKEPFNPVTTLFNFKWQQTSIGIDYNNLDCDSSSKQLVNHYENHYSISNKANMFINLMEYCEKRKISVFKFVPFTIVFQFKDKINFENNNEIMKHESKKLEELKKFIKNYQNYIVNYDKIGKFYEDEKFQKSQIRRYTHEIKDKKKLKKEKKKEEQKSDNNININKDHNNEMKLYHDYFQNMKVIEKIPKIIKDKDGSYIPVEEKINENIGKNTLIEIPETHASGNNLWIIKAINLNRGMCIKVVNSFEKMEKTLKKFKEGVKYNFSRESDENKIKLKDNFFKNIVNTDIEITEENEKITDTNDKMYYCSRIIIQKYIEKPLLYKKRKCDIRIWVLLTQIMKVYVFKEGHLKTCSVEYNSSSNNPYTHITNYSFQKHNNNFQKFEKGNEVPFYDFQKFIDENYPEKKYKLNVDLMDKIKEIVYITMRSVKKLNKNKRNHSFEIFGYDFMLDENFNLFLIEINTNPGLEESSPWIKIIIPRMLDDALRLTLDQLFDTKYDFNLNYKRSHNLEDILDDAINQNQNIKKENHDDKKNIKYKSPFPVPGYELDENLWDFVCDLNDIDLLDELINDNNKTFDEIKHLLKLKHKPE